MTNTLGALPDAEHVHALTVFITAANLAAHSRAG